MSGVTTLTVSINWNQTETISAQNGGAIDLSGLVTISTPGDDILEITADGLGSFVDVRNVTDYLPSNVTFNELNQGKVPHQDPGGPADADGDGVPDWDEVNLHGTDPAEPDTDLDGMSDGYEVDHRLNPLADDAHADTDTDGYTNIEEFHRNTNPRDPDDPRRSYFISPDGSDVALSGTQEHPWQTIGYALSQVEATEMYPAIFLLAAGTYGEDVSLEAYLTVQGPSDADAIIAGAVTGASASALRNLCIEVAGSVLLDMNDVAMEVRELCFAGAGSTGIQVQGEAPSDSLITKCTFSGLDTGVEIFDALPTVRKCVFDDIQTGILVHAAAPAKDSVHGLGLAEDPNSGYNTFGSVSGSAVVNEGDAPLRMENNDWSTDELGEITAMIDGEADVEPFLAAGKALLAGTLIRSIWDADTLERITDGAVETAGFVITENVDGTYVFASLPAGDYVVTTTAPGYLDDVQNATLYSGEVLPIASPLRSSGETGSDAGFSATPTSGFAPLEVSFLDQSTAPPSITAWAWDFGDSETSTEQNPTHTYQSAGTYTITLSITTASGGDTETKPAYITVNDTVPPSAAFSAAPTFGFSPLQVQFNDESVAGTASITAWLWDFGDGESSTEQDPAHTYSIAGQYDVSLTVTTGHGEDTETKAAFISVQDVAGPTALFSGTPTSGDVPLEVLFTDESDPGTSAIASWLWDFGDGGTSDEQHPSHTYDASGDYDVSLTVSTEHGSSTETKTAYITATETSGQNQTDIDGNGAVNASDVQLVINAALGIDTGYNCDVDGDGATNATDVQLVINAALGL